MSHLGKPIEQVNAQLVADHFANLTGAKRFVVYLVMVPSPTGGSDCELCEFGHTPEDLKAAQEMAHSHGGWVNRVKRVL